MDRRVADPDGAAAGVVRQAGVCRAIGFISWLAVVALLPAGLRAEEHPAGLAGLAPEDTFESRSVFFQASAGERTSAITAGVTWALPERLAPLGPRWRLHLEASAARWTPRERDRAAGDPAHFTRVGLTPALRYLPQEDRSRWFVEAGVGINLIGPVYRVRDKRFGSAFNFGDHAAIGWIPDTARRQEWTLRLQHFSNAGLRQPNPGENFLQLRWAWRF